MVQMFRCGMWLLAALLLPASMYATTLTGTLRSPSGAVLSGRLSVQLTRQGVLNTCVTPAVVVPATPVFISVVNGTLTNSPDIVPTDCLNVFQPYAVEFRDGQNAVLFREFWWITLPGGAYGTPVATAAVRATDDFNRASLGGNWTANNGTFDIFSSTAIYSTSASGTFTGIHYSATAFGNDQASQAVVQNVQTGGASTGTAVRLQSGAWSGYTSNNFPSGEWRISRRDTGTEVILARSTGSPTCNSGAAPATHTPALGDVYRLDMRGTLLRAYINGVLWCEKTDATYSSGYPGIAIRAQGDTTGRLDNWVGQSGYDEMEGDAWVSPAGLALSTYDLPVAFRISEFTGGVRTRSVSTGTVGGGLSANVSVTWTQPFADATYTAVCTLKDAATPAAPLVYVSDIPGKTAAGLTVTVSNFGSASASGTLTCRGRKQ